MHKLLMLAMLAAAIPDSFEVASIRPSNPKQVGQFVQFLPGGRFTVDNCMVSSIVLEVYALEDYQLADAPKWISDWDYRYDIQAKAPSAVDREQIREMAKSLLAERFGFKAHREIRQIPVYAIVPARAGIRLNTTEKPPSGIEFVSAGVIRGRSTIAGLIRAISRNLYRPVIDDTNFPGRFDFRLEWAPENAADDDPRPSLFTALQEQLGLKLEAQKAPVEILAIDHVEKPSAN